MKRVTLQQLGKTAVLMGRLPRAAQPQTCPEQPQAWADQLRRAAALRSPAAAPSKFNWTRLA